MHGAVCGALVQICVLWCCGVLVLSLALPPVAWWWLPLPPGSVSSYSPSYPYYTPTTSLHTYGTQSNKHSTPTKQSKAHKSKAYKAKHTHTKHTTDKATSTQSTNHASNRTRRTHHGIDRHTAALGCFAMRRLHVMCVPDVCCCSFVVLFTACSRCDR